MNLGGIVGSMSLPGSMVTRKSNDVPDQFPAGLRVLVVDDDLICLTILGKMLRDCRHKVTKTNRAEEALRLLRESRSGYDIVVSDVHMPDIDGFKLLERVGLEMDLPVIMMSADDSKNVVMKGVTHGACDYLIKPIRIEALKNIWQHVVRKKKNEWKDIEQSGSWDEGDRHRKQDEVVSSSANDGGWKNSKRKGDDEDTDDRDDSATLKKPRVVWSVELHQQFVAAVNQLGIDKAVPKKILELMNVPGLTRENVASHLQKYRLYLRRISGVSQHQVGLNNSYMPQDSGFSAMTSLGGIDLQTLASNSQISAQSLASYNRIQPAIKSGISMPFIDQKNLFSFENSKVRYGDGHQQQLSNVNKQVNLLHGIPTTMEPKQLAGLNQPAQNLMDLNIQANASGNHQSSSLVMQMIPQQARGQILNENVGGQGPGIQSTARQSMPPSNTASGVLLRNGIAYNPISQTGPRLDFSANQVPDLPGSSFPLGSTPGISSITSKGINHREISSDIKTTRGYVGGYDVFNELQQHKSQEWQLPNPGMAFGGSSQQVTSMQSSVNVAPSVLVSQPHTPNQRSENNENALAGKPTSSCGLENQRVSMQNTNQNSFNGIPVNSNTSRVKSERISEFVSPGSNLFAEHYGQEDLMSALLRPQQQGGVPSGEYDFDGYTMDNVPV